MILKNKFVVKVPSLTAKVAVHAVHGSAKVECMDMMWRINRAPRTVTPWRHLTPIKAQLRQAALRLQVAYTAVNPEVEP